MAGYGWDNDPEAWRRAAHEELRSLREGKLGWGWATVLTISVILHSCNVDRRHLDHHERMAADSAASAAP